MCILLSNLAIQSLRLSGSACVDDGEWMGLGVGGPTRRKKQAALDTAKKTMMNILFILKSNACLNLCID